MLTFLYLKKNVETSDRVEYPQIRYAIVHDEHICTCILYMYSLKQISKVLLNTSNLMNLIGQSPMTSTCMII